MSCKEIIQSPTQSNKSFYTNIMEFIVTPIMNTFLLFAIWITTMAFRRRNWKSEETSETAIVFIKHFYCCCYFFVIL